MFLIVATVISLISVSAGEYMSHPMPSKHAISSQSYHREDVPLSYRFSAVHIYTTPKPLKAGHEPHVYYQASKPNLDPRDFRSVQYAPLVDSPQYSKLSVSKPQKSPSNPNQNDFETRLNKDHLEPKIVNKPEVYPTPLMRLEYVPGKKIHVMQSANRIPAHNAVYNTYSENIPNEKLNKINYLRQYLIYQNAQRQAQLGSQNIRKAETTTATVNPKLTEIALVPLLRPIGDQFSGPKAKTYTIEKPKVADIELPYKSPPQKMHALFLNVARSYNFLPAGLHTGANPVSILGKSQPLPLSRISRLSNLEVPPRESKTVLLPMQKNVHFAIHS